MAKRKNEGGTFLKNIIIVILVLALLGGIFCGVWYITSGFGGNLAAFGVKYGENTYFTPQSGLTVSSGAKFEIVNPVSKDYKIRITACGDTDFEFRLDEEPFRWADMSGQDFTKGFQITKAESGFTLEYESFPAIMKAVTGQAVTLTESANGDPFVLEVTANGSSLRLSFHLDSMICGLTLDHQSYRF